MKVAEQYEICIPFFQQLRRAAERVLLLDYDGTLAPFTPDRTRAFPYRDIPGTISRIMAAGTRVVLISGRSARELLFLSGILIISGIQLFFLGLVGEMLRHYSYRRGEEYSVRRYLSRD